MIMVECFSNIAFSLSRANTFADLIVENLKVVTFIGRFTNAVTRNWVIDKASATYWMIVRNTLTSGLVKNKPRKAKRFLHASALTSVFVEEISVVTI